MSKSASGDGIRAIVLALLTPLIKRMLKGNSTVDPAGASSSNATTGA
ncbi:hypothetical protein [Chromohalobacter sp. HP20-39]|nr:hypothetical protein [Chromohalobacter sp. HP20-39]MDV6317965.1 hypothetical protein [Chromohalobacter sp. HP20-39]